MSMEEDILKRDLSKAETVEAVEEIKQSAEDMGINIENLLNERLAAISGKAEAVGTTTPAQISQVESMGGSVGEVEKRTTEIDQQIATAKAEAEEKIGQVQNEENPTETPGEVATSPEEAGSEQIQKDTSESETNPSGATEQKESPADVAFGKLREEMAHSAAEKKDKVVIDNKLVDMAEITANPDLAKQIDWTRPASMAVALNLLEKNIVSAQDILKGIANMQSIDLENVPEELFKKIKEKQPMAFSEVAKSFIERNKGMLDDPRLRMTILANIIRIPGGVGILDGMGLKGKIFEIRDRFIKEANENPERMVRATEGFEALFDASTKNLIPREDLIRWLKEGVASTKMDVITFGLSVRKILSLEENGKISREEADVIIKNSPNYEKYLK